MKLSDLPPLSYWFCFSQAVAAVLWLIGTDSRTTVPFLGEVGLSRIGGFFFIAGWLGVGAYWLGLRKWLPHPESPLPALFSLFVCVFWVSQMMAFTLWLLDTKTPANVPLLGEVRLKSIGNWLFLAGMLGFLGWYLSLRPKPFKRAEPLQLFKGFGSERRYGNRK